jgi:choline dehydrogenase-like flavoprotein
MSRFITGAGGAVAAAELTRAGHSVIVIDKGMYITPSRALAAGINADVEMFEGGNTLMTDDARTTVLSGATWGGSVMVNSTSDCSLHWHFICKVHWILTELFTKGRVEHMSAPINGDSCHVVQMLQTSHP